LTRTAGATWTIGATWTGGGGVKVTAVAGEANNSNVAAIAILIVGYSSSRWETAAGR